MVDEEQPMSTAKAESVCCSRVRQVRMQSITSTNDASRYGAGNTPNGKTGVPRREKFQN
jgi:hypothetical protein